MPGLETVRVDLNKIALSLAILATLAGGLMHWSQQIYDLRTEIKLTHTLVSEFREESRADRRSLNAKVNELSMEVAALKARLDAHIAMGK